MKVYLIILYVLSPLLILTEALFFNLPAWLFVLYVLFLTVSTVIYFRKQDKKIWKKIIFYSLSLIIGLGMLAYAFCYPYFGSTVFKLKPNYYIQNAQVTVTKGQAIKDLNFIVKKLKHIHVSLKNPESENSKKINAAYEKAKVYLNSKENFTVVELAQQIESVLSVLGDAHSTVSLMYKESEHYYKNVQKHNDDSDSFIGFNGKLFEDLLKEKNNLYSYEKESWAIQKMANHSISLEGLDYMGIDMENGITYMLETEDGVLYEETAKKSDFITYDEYVKYNHLENRSQEESKPFCYYSIYEDKSLAVFTLTSCDNNQFYKDTLNRLFTEIKEKNIQNLAIDVRNNGGGSSLVINNLFKYLNIDSFIESAWISRYGPFIKRYKSPVRKNDKVENLVFSGKVYLLCSAKSFSSAMMFAQYVKDNGVGTIIGQAPGNDPNGYGEVVRFDLPESHLFVQISRKQFTRINQNTDEVYVEPDIPCEPDKALEVLMDVL